ncbi:hypothetical protein MTR_6g079910 [Medicago truncatula]|uniref:Uncharacterized protein n=1 Tax=Medicago truncatula TaxID=3880 RepID=G7KLL4_MEDTR|nr:hypothetical protein MTR_6g079910 [Medicago truncatula]
METKVAGATSNRLYEDFEPYCKWITKEGQKILEIDLKAICLGRTPSNLWSPTKLRTRNHIHNNKLIIINNIKNSVEQSKNAYSNSDFIITTLTGALQVEDLAAHVLAVCP